MTIETKRATPALGGPKVDGDGVQRGVAGAIKNAKESASQGKQQTAKSLSPVLFLSCYYSCWSFLGIDMKNNVTLSCHRWFFFPRLFFAFPNVLFFGVFLTNFCVNAACCPPGEEISWFLKFARIFTEFVIQNRRNNTLTSIAYFTKLNI